MKPPTLMAFALSVLSFSIAAPGYAQDASAGRALAATCFTCHGTNGNSVDGVPPSLAGRSSTELFQMMKDFQTGKRPATIMHQQARGYTDDQLKLIAAYYASLKPVAAARPPKP